MKSIFHKIALLIIIFTAGFLFFLLLDFSYPMPDATKIKKFSQIVVDRNGQPLRAFADKQGVWRYPTNYSKVSHNYIEALINYEDRNYWQHHGINPFSLFRAVKQFVFNGRAISGGSTLTMQVARILEPHSKSVSGKLWQMFRAFQLEYYLNKKEILELYLNYAPFGGPIEGIEAATYTYLGKSAQVLTDAEAALMAVLPQSPSRFRPDRHAQRAQKARNKVLDRLNKYNVWSKQQVTQAKQESVYAVFNSKPLVAPLLARRLVKQFPDRAVINSTIDLEQQLLMADQVKAFLNRFSESTSASALLINNQSLEVLAYVGAGDFANQKRFGHVDMNQAIRSPGSTLKPFIYAMAMDKQLIHSESLLQDVPLNFGTYSPKNFTREFSGPVSTSQALQRSLNIPVVQVLNHLGAENFSGQIENAGLKLHFTNKSKPSLSLALGGVGVKLEGLVSIYRSLAAGGLSGRLRYTKESKKQQSYLISKESAWIIGDILSKVPLLGGRRRLVKNQSIETKAQWLAHKTGTSYGYRDAWMVAVTSEHTLAVWIGKPDGSPSPGEFGRKTAAPLVNKIIASVSSQNQQQPKRPNKVKAQLICWPVGRLKATLANDLCMSEKKAWIIDDVAPLTLNEQRLWKTNPLEIEIDPITKQRVFSSCFLGKKYSKRVAVWPSRLDLWLPVKWRSENLLPIIHTDCKNNVDINHKLIVLGVDHGSRISAPPNVNVPFNINLSILSGKGEISWLKNGEIVGKSSAKESFTLTNLEKGIHKIMVFDQNGSSGSVEFELL